MEEDGLIEAKKIGESKRGDDVLAYRLTPPGLRLLLLKPEGVWDDLELADPWKKIERIIKNYPEYFPDPIVNNWDYIKENDLESFIIESGRVSTNVRPVDSINNVFLLEKEKLKPEEEIPEEALSYRKSLLNWRRCVREKPELREWALRHLKKYEKIKEEDLREIRRAIEELSNS